jgi:hypothetical protein
MAQLVGMGRGVGMSRIAVSIQTLDGRKDTYLRAVCKSLGEV